MRSGGGQAEARALVAAGDWRGALATLDAAPDELDAAEHLELRAQAAYGAGEFEVAIASWEELHTLQLRAGDVEQASRAAAMVSMYLMIDTGLMATVRGWLRRAESLVEDHPESTAHAFIAMVRTYERFMCGDMDAARREAARAIELGERLGVIPATVIGRVATARIRILEGDVTDGVGLLDEVAVLLTSPDVDPLTTGMMYCELICAAQGLALHDRAAEWTDVMDHWRPGEAIGGISGRCRVHRAEMLRLTGPCDMAEQEALAACEELRPWMRREFGWPLVELANIRLQKGDLAGAEEAYLAAHDHGWFPQPGLALLRLAQGEVTDAAALIADAVAHPVDVPSKERPPFGDLRLAPLLAAQVEIAIAADDTATAAAAAERLRSIADRYSSCGLEAAASLAEARVALASGDLELAVRAATTSVMTWADVRAPFETATARLVLGEAHRRAGAEARAVLEFEAAGTAFEQFGAASHALAARALAGRDDRPPHPGVRVPPATFRLEGGTRRVCFADIEVVVRDLKGLRYVSHLLTEPGREFHVLDLVALERGAEVDNPTLEDGVDFIDGVGSGLPMLDEQARQAYRRRLADVDDDIDDARRNNDIGRLELAERDREYLLAELRRAAGFGGAIRSTGGSAERARTAVTRSIRYALARLSEHHAVAAEHLGQRIQTGTFCSYTSDPMLPVVWDT